MRSSRSFAPVEAWLFVLSRRPPTLDDVVTAPGVGWLYEGVLLHRPSRHWSGCGRLSEGTEAEPVWRVGTNARLVIREETVASWTSLRCQAFNASVGWALGS